MRLLPAQEKIIKDKLQKLKTGAIYYSDDMGTEDEGEDESEEEEVDGDEGAEEEDEDNKKKKTRRPTKGNFVKLAFKQECIPIGCIPPVAVAVSPATHAPPRPPCTPPCHTCPLLCMRPVMHAPLPHHAHSLPCMHAPLTCTPTSPAMHAPSHCHTCLPAMHPPIGQTDTCKNITFTNFVSSFSGGNNH